VAREEFLDIQRREEGWIVGTRGYIAPEVVRREAITQAVDIFAFGVIAFELLTGAKPFAGDHLERDQHVALPSTLNPALPADIDQPLLETLASAPAERPQMASPAARRIREAIDAEGERRSRSAEPAPAKSPNGADSAGRRSRRGRPCRKRCRVDERAAPAT
jgi:serine/threonine-protein kinase